jgi:hypothetical protein
MDGFGSVQPGETPDTRVGLSLGSRTEDLAQQLIAQHELAWEKADLP